MTRDADRWPSAQKWVRLDDGEIDTWTSTRDHRKRRSYAR